MRFATIERLKFSLGGRSVPVVKVADSNEEGKVLSLQMLGAIKDRPNSLVSTWDEKGYEKDQSSPGYLNLIDEKGTCVSARLVSHAGRTVDLYVHPFFRNASPNREDIIGHAATMDDIADSMDLGHSYRNIAIGAILSGPIWWLIIQAVGVFLK
jgi:hypothetical protein